jgi:hypothetical protein
MCSLKSPLLFRPNLLGDRITNELARISVVWSEHNQGAF